jgi:hypothetical protein
MLEREKAGLRGLVRTCLEEATHPAIPGTDIPERTYSHTMEYDVQGHVTLFRGPNSDGSEWVTRFTYDAAGHLLKTTAGKNGDISQETNNSYDDQGRQLAITDSNAPDNPIAFRYDEHGRKTKVQISHPEDYRPNHMVAGSPFETADRAPNLPDGGSATTFYDADDRPTEVHVKNAQGGLITRAVIIYNAEGRVSEEKQILDNVETMFPEGLFDKMLEESGASREELHKQISKVMGGQTGPFSIAYSYNAAGRLKQMRRQIFNQEQLIETTYNEQGDKASEITLSSRLGDVNESDQKSPLPPYSEVRYSYLYDDRGNWTEETISHRSTPEGAFESGTKRRRTFRYY